jgi:diguanylate cyclase (GGDEF)-like protein/PAS domain S-box-containing protein
MPVGEPNLPQRAPGPPAAQLLDCSMVGEFKDFLELIGFVCGFGNGKIHLHGEEHQALIASIDPDAVEMPLDACLCSQTAGEKDPCVVSDLREDTRFCNHPLVVREPSLRFYAGYPLITSSNEKIGSLCICDSEPLLLTAVQQETLRALARRVVAHIELKNQLIALGAEIQEKNDIAHALETSDSRFRAFLNASPVSVFIKDEETRMLYCNKALADRFGATPEDWIGKTDLETWPPEIAETFRKSDLQALESNREIHFEDHTTGPDGRMVTWDVHKYPFADASGNRSLACMALDVTRTWEAQQEVQRVQQELRVANDRLHTLSLTDALTGLMNRRALEDCLENERVRCLLSGAPLSLFMLDIDNFKNFNDSYGHVYGDEVLREVSVLMQQWTRRGDMVARYGGEEFLVILPGADATVALRVAERVREAIEGADWKFLPITVSIGVAAWHEGILTMTDFIHEADEALYAAKCSGKNQVCRSRNMRVA